MSKTLKFSIALGLQILIILVIIIFKVAQFTGGTEVLLKLAPIDPRDPLRGDYLNLRYDISSVSGLGGQALKNGDVVYVPLQKSGSFWIAGPSGGLQKNKPAQTDSNTVYIKGTIMNGGQDSGLFGYYNTGSFTIKYNIESYFVPEGKGNTWELTSWSRCYGDTTCLDNANLPENQPFAKVVVDDNGDAVLKQLYIDGKPWPQGGDKLQLTPDNSTWTNPSQQNLNQTSVTVPVQPNGQNGGQTAVAQPASQPVAVQFVPYKSAKFGYSFNYPSNLLLTESAYDKNTNTQGVTLNISGVATSFMQISNMPNYYNYPTLDAYAAKYSTSYEVSRTYKTIASKRALEIQSKYTVTTLFMSTDTKQVYSLLLWGPGTAGSSDRLTYDQILQSFQY